MDEYFRSLGEFQFAQIDGLFRDLLPIDFARGDEFGELGVLGGQRRGIGIGGDGAVGSRLSSLNGQRRRDMEAWGQAFDGNVDLAVEIIRALGDNRKLLAAAGADSEVRGVELDLKIWTGSAHRQ